MMSLMNNAFQNSSSSIVSSKFSGDLEDLRVAPITQAQILWAMSLGSVIRGTLVAGITLLVGQLFHQYLFSEFIQIAHWWAVLFFAVFAGLIFGLIGISIAFCIEFVFSFCFITAHIFRWGFCFYRTFAKFLADVMSNESLILSYKWFALWDAWTGRC